MGQQGYASVGYHVGDFLPYLLLSGSRAPPIIKAGSAWGPLLGEAAASLQNSAVAILNSHRTAQSTIALGMRWDFDSRAALKIQWDHVRVRTTGWGIWTVPAADEGLPGQANVLSATLDFVF